jgi:hypothetical protein
MYTVHHNIQLNGVLVLMELMEDENRAKSAQSSHTMVAAPVQSVCIHPQQEEAIY